MSPLTDTAAIKAALDFRALVARTHDVNRDGKIPCPAHDDGRNPNCHIYADHAFCFACGWHADAIEWLKVVHGFSTGDAIKEAEHLAGTMPPPAPRRQGPPRRNPSTSKQCDAKPLPEGARKRHLKLVEETYRVPPSLIGRGIYEEDLEPLLIAELEHGDAGIAVTGPHGEMLNVKRRHQHVRNGQRYRYEVAGLGSPAWCSPGILESTEILVIEGELNGIATWLARPDLGVMGVAGTNGCLFLDVLAGRTVYVYADPDMPGDKARDRWAALAHAAGAERVYIIRPWKDGDACDVAGHLGRDALRRRLE